MTDINGFIIDTGFSSLRLLFASDTNANCSDNNSYQQNKNSQQSTSDFNYYGSCNLKIDSYMKYS